MRASNTIPTEGSLGPRSAINRSWAVAVFPRDFTILGLSRSSRWDDSHDVGAAHGVGGLGALTRVLAQATSGNFDALFAAGGSL